ncbi:MAG: DegT/DnrJ/EryC1/StrS family aminotransferase [Bacteroidota bacterium]
MITVTKPFMPPRAIYQQYLDKIWERQWLTNNGKLVQRLEQEISNFLGIQQCAYVSNGTLALQMAIKVLDLTGEIITTPFSYVATTSSIVWEGCTPIFADIDPNTLNIDPQKIEACITDRTSAILATHVFGNPCDVEAIQNIADRHNLKVIYDGAHAFGVKYKGESIYDFGDISISSFHATKLFHTVEGGGIFAKDEAVMEKIRLLRNFGHTSATTFDGVGINGKSSELHAAMGLSVLPFVPDIIERRMKLAKHYKTQLQNTDVAFPTLMTNTTYNYAYFPILLPSEAILLELKATLEANDIYPRRYFYPSLSSLEYVTAQSTPIADDIASRVLCLPYFYELKATNIDTICTIIQQIVATNTELC